MTLDPVTSEIQEHKNRQKITNFQRSLKNITKRETSAGGKS